MVPRIAVVGGGISGACAAWQLTSSASPSFDVTVFDQGRRGPGGRASHRSVSVSDGTVCSGSSEESEGPTYEFDHGCQFFRADSSQMQSLVDDWCQRGFAARWNGKFGSLPQKTTSGEANIFDFFGFTTNPNPVYIGVGGMHQLPQKLLRHSNATIRSGTRVSQIERTPDGKWELIGVSGHPAFHDTKETQAVAGNSLGTFDAVLLTDISSASDSWHRASAGIPQSLRAKLPSKLRMPLFACMVALDTPIRKELQLDAFTVSGDPDSPLWFAACSQSKPSFLDDTVQECWTLVSTPAFAVDQITQLPMRDPITGAFRPQDNEYLNSIPGPALFAAFSNLVSPLLSKPPQHVYLQAQRWGSGLPIPSDMVDTEHIHQVTGDRFVSRLSKPLVFEKSSSPSNDFVADDDAGLYYAGDFCSRRNPGFEAAALSGVDAAKHMAKILILKSVE